MPLEKSDSDHTKDPTLVVRANSVALWLRKRLEFLKDNDSLLWPPYIPHKRIFIVLSIDFGQGSTKLTRRIMNVPEDLVRGPCNLDPLVVFDGPGRVDADWNRRWVRYRHCRNRRTSFEQCLRHVHVRNRCRILVRCYKSARQCHVYIGAFYASLCPVHANLPYMSNFIAIA